MCCTADTKEREKEGRSHWSTQLQRKHQTCDGALWRANLLLGKTSKKQYTDLVANTMTIWNQSRVFPSLLVNIWHPFPTKSSRFNLNHVYFYNCLKHTHLNLNCFRKNIYIDRHYMWVNITTRTQCIQSAVFSCFCCDIYIFPKFSSFPKHTWTLPLTFSWTVIPE